MKSTLALPPFRRQVLTAVCALAVAGCTTGPDFARPEAGLGQLQLTPRGDYGEILATSPAQLPTQWWTLFNDATLSALQQRAQADNLDLQMAAGRIAQSRAQLGITSAELLPTLALDGGYAREANSEHGKFVALGASPATGNFWQLGFDASWELDLWGRARRADEGAAAMLQATLYEREAMQVSLSAEVARIYLQLRGTQAQLIIAAESDQLAARALNLAESRERNGVANRFETATARAQLATTRAATPSLQQRRNTLMNALALLLGAQPRALDAELRTTMPLPNLPLEIPVGLPSELARRRPDIQRAEAELHAATAAIGVAKADFYPRIGLRGRLGLESFESGDLLNWNSRAFSVGPTVYLPMFDGGRLTQRLALTEARQKNTALAYRRTVLQAWHEVDNALDACAAQQRQHAELQLSYEQNVEALKVALRGYQEGAADYLSVLTAQRNLLTSQTSLNDSATHATLVLVNLYKSLGGGWSTDLALVPDTPALSQGGQR